MSCLRLESWPFPDHHNHTHPYPTTSNKHTPTMSVVNVEHQQQHHSFSPPRQLYNRELATPPNSASSTSSSSSFLQLQIPHADDHYGAPPSTPQNQVQDYIHENAYFYSPAHTLYNSQALQNSPTADRGFESNVSPPPRSAGESL